MILCLLSFFFQIDFETFSMFRNFKGFRFQTWIRRASTRFYMEPITVNRTDYFVAFYPTLRKLSSFMGTNVLDGAELSGALEQCDFFIGDAYHLGTAFGDYFGTNHRLGRLIFDRNRQIRNGRRYFD